MILPFQTLGSPDDLDDDQSIQYLGCCVIVACDVDAEVVMLDRRQSYLSCCRYVKFVVAVAFPGESSMLMLKMSVRLLDSEKLMLAHAIVSGCPMLSVVLENACIDVWLLLLLLLRKAR